MRFGLFFVPTDQSIQPVQLGKVAEELGYECVLLPQHTHIPLAETTEFPLGGDLPDEYRRALDPLVALTAIASATSVLKVGTGVCLVLQNELVTLAKAVATLDQLSGGRVLFGVGAGWNVAEMRTHGIDPRTRMPAMVESVQALKAIWSDEVASFRGTYVQVPPMWSWPKPAQRPYPPILVGGNHHRMLDRVVALDADWLPNAGKFPLERLERAIALLRGEAQRLGKRRPGVSVFRAEPKPAVIERYIAAGVERCVFAMPPATPEESIARVRRWSGLVKQFA